MSTFFTLVRRNCKLFFKDKGMFFSSLITPIILLVLYVAFLKRVYENSFSDYMPAGTPVDLVNATVGGQLISSLLAVCTITVSFCSNLIMVQDKVTGALNDFMVTPIKRPIIGIAYYVSSAFSSLIVCFTATALGLVYLAATGWYFTAGDVFMILLDVFLLVMFGTALSSVINVFLKTQGQMSAVGTIVSAGYGFVCGAYMPLSSSGEVIRNIFSFFPGTYGTTIIRNHSLVGAFREMEAQGWPTEAIEGIKDSVDCNMYFFGNKVEIWTSYLILVGTILLLLGVYILLNAVMKPNAKKISLKKTKKQL